MSQNIAQPAKGSIEYRLEGSGPTVVVLNGGLQPETSQP
jgi:hypothetical protein